ncbi:hypothetical protein IWQ61_006591 [Dispira simplex]|nr:hypothetical protein IWQ61_006591 [Dispira simplex]
MLPGVIHPPGGLPVVQRGQVVSVAVSGFPAPVAVGLMELSTEEIRTSKTNKGKAVHILHTYQDYLWKQGDQSHPTVPSNEAPVDSEQGKLEDSTYNASTDQGVDKAPAANGPDAPEPELEDVPPALSPVEMDEWLQKCLMQALCTTLNKERLAPLLPLSISALYSSYMMASRPVNIQLDVKKSTFKKLAKFFKTMEKKGILKTKDIKGGDTVVTTVNHQHPELLAFEPMKKSALVTSAPSDGANSGSSRSPGESSALISFTDMFRPRSALVEFIHTAGLEPQPYYTRQELRTIMVDYIKHKQLKDPRQPKLVALDEPLAKLLLCSNEAGISHPHLTHEKIVERLFVATELAHCLTFPDGTTEIRKGSPTKISVIMEKKMGHKTITKISNHELYRLDTDTLAKQLQHACAASVTTHAIPVKGKKLVYHEIIAQGPQGKIVMQLLEKNGVPSSLVDIQDKTGKTKGKK